MEQSQESNKDEYEFLRKFVGVWDLKNILSYIRRCACCKKQLNIEKNSLTYIVDFDIYLVKNNDIDFVYANTYHKYIKFVEIEPYVLNKQTVIFYKIQSFYYLNQSWNNNYYLKKMIEGDNNIGIYYEEKYKSKDNYFLFNKVVFDELLKQINGKLVCSVSCCYKMRDKCADICLSIKFEYKLKYKYQDILHKFAKYERCSMDELSKKDKAYFIMLCDKYKKKWRHGLYKDVLQDWMEELKI